MEHNDDISIPNKVPSSWDINELVRLLRQERLFVLSEQQELQSLNERVRLFPQSALFEILAVVHVILFIKKKKSRLYPM